MQRQMDLIKRCAPSYIEKFMRCSRARSLRTPLGSSPIFIWCWYSWNNTAQLQKASCESPPVFTNNIAHTRFNSMRVYKHRAKIKLARLVDSYMHVILIPFVWLQSKSWRLWKIIIRQYVSSLLLSKLAKWWW